MRLARYLGREVALSGSAVRPSSSKQVEKTVAISGIVDWTSEAIPKGRSQFID